MSTFLWTMVILSTINTACFIWSAATIGVQPAPRWAKAVDVLITAGFGCWALWLLAKGAV